jgi:hypothetical protein
MERAPIGSLALPTEADAYGVIFSCTTYLPRLYEAASKGALRGPLPGFTASALISTASTPAHRP